MIDAQCSRDKLVEGAEERSEDDRLDEVDMILETYLLPLMLFVGETIVVIASLGKRHTTR